MISLSIIVPVYNVASYLDKCVDSLLSQDISENQYEIILIDDGSVDGSGEIAERLAIENENVITVHQNNSGLSAARNKGVSIARGKYIQFVDSDDYLEPEMLSSLLEKMEADNLDILRFNYQNVDENYQVFEPNKDGKPFVDYRDEVCNGIEFLNERLGYACYAVQFLIRSELAKATLFTEGIVFEDTDWTPRLLVKANRVTSLNLIVYNYLVRKDSITTSNSLPQLRASVKDRISLINSLSEQSKSVSDSRWFDGMIAFTCLSILKTVSVRLYKERRDYVRFIKAKVDHPLSYYHTTRRSRRKIRLINLSPAFFCFVYHIKNGSSY